MIHRKKNRPALQRHDIVTVSLGFSFFQGICLGLLPPSSYWFCSFEQSLELYSAQTIFLIYFFRAFFVVFLYPVIRLSGFALFSN